jgi:hypothetical protein
MKEFNKPEYNNLCAEFLGYVNTTPTDKDFNIYENEKSGIIIGNKIYTMLETMSMKFDSDWNWIMEVVEKINSLDLKISIEHEDVVYSLVTCKKQVVVERIWNFLNWYNEQNK